MPNNFKILLNNTFLKKWANPGLFLFIFVIFQNTNFTEIIVVVSGMRTRIVGEEGKYAVHLTTTTAQQHLFSSIDRTIRPQSSSDGV